MNSLTLKHNPTEETMALMMRRYERMLLRFCTRQLRDWDLAQDAVQETFLKAYLKRDSFRGTHEGSERAWLMQIAANTCRDQQRTRWARNANRRVDVESVEIPVLLNEEALMTKWAVTTLSEPYRDLVLMYYYQDMTTREIASAVRQSPSAVYRNLRKAREMLSKLL